MILVGSVFSYLLQVSQVAVWTVILVFHHFLLWALMLVSDLPLSKLKNNLNSVLCLKGDSWVLFQNTTGLKLYLRGIYFFGKVRYWDSYSIICIILNCGGWSRNTEHYCIFATTSSHSQSLHERTWNFHIEELVFVIWDRVFI